MNPLTEQRIGPYRILERVGHGSMADVYRARHEETGAVVALKVPHAGDGFWEAERGGALIQKALHQMEPHVPRVDEIRDGPECYIAMEYVDGEDLSRKLERGRLPWGEALAIARQLLAVLTSARLCPADAVRRGGIVHGDIKPSNVRVTPAGEVRLLDFGIAKTLLESGQGTINRFQSLAYCSPERLADTKVNVHADLWAVAVVVYEMVAGARPFRAASPEELYERIRSGQARAAPLDAAVPVRLAAVIEMALDPVIDRRYQSAEEFENDLAAAAEERTTLAERRLELRRLEESTRRAVPPALPTNESPADRDASNGAATLRTGPPAGHDGSNGAATTRTFAPADRDAPNGAATTRSPATNGDAAHGAETVRGAATPNGSTPHVQAGNGAAIAGTPRLRGERDPAATRQTAAARGPGLASVDRGGAPLAPYVPAALAKGSTPSSRRSPLNAILVLILVASMANELWAVSSLRELQSQLPGLARADSEAVWKRYVRLRGRSFTLKLTGPLFAGGIKDWMLSHADDLIGRFLLDGTAIRENGWIKARTLLQHAAVFSPTDRKILARIDYCNGQIARIGAAAAADRAAARSLSDDAVTHFQNAARRWPRWPDPNLGLAAVYAYGRREPESAETSVARAGEAGYEVGERETALLGDAFRLRAESMWSRPTDQFTAQRRHDHLLRIRSDYTRALDYYERAPDYGHVPDHLSNVQARLAQLDQRIERLIGETFETVQ